MPLFRKRGAKRAGSSRRRSRPTGFRIKPRTRRGRRIVVRSRGSRRKTKSSFKSKRLRRGRGGVKRRHAGLARAIAAVAKTKSSQQNNTIDAVTMLTIPDNFAVTSNRTYDTLWDNASIGACSTVQSNLVTYQIWLNTAVNFSGIATSSPEWSLTMQKYLYESLNTHRYTNMNNFNIEYRVLRCRPRHDIPAGVYLYYGFGNPPASTIQVSAKGMMVYQDIEAQQVSSAANLLTYQNRNYNWKKQSSLTKYYKITESKKRILAPGKSMTITQRLHPTLVDTTMYGAISGTTGAPAQAPYYAFRGVYEEVLTQFIPQIGLTVTPTPSVRVGATGAIIMRETRSTVKICAVKNESPSWGYTSSGLTDVSTTIAVVSDHGSTGVVAIHC